MPIIRTLLSPGLFRLYLAAFVLIDHSMQFAKLGLAAVFLFFTLSGYWIYQMWQRSYSQTSRPAFVFIVSRLWRLLPIFMACMLVMIGTHLLFNDPPPWHGFHEFFSHAFILGYGELDRQSMILPAAWSLDMELQFYLLVPAIIFILDSPKAGRLARPLLLAAAASALALLAFNWLMAEPEAIALPRLLPTNLPYFLAFFLIGMMPAKFHWRPSNALTVACLVLMMAVMATIYAVPLLRGIVMVGKHGNALFAYHRTFNIALALVAAPVALFTVHQAAPAWDRHVGNLSYEFYLLNEVACYLLEHPVPPFTLAHRNVLFTAIMAAITLIALLLYRLIDQPMNRARTKFVARWKVAGKHPPIAQGADAENRVVVTAR